MKHFNEVLQTLGASSIILVEESNHWDFWKAVYSTPVSEVEGFYLYLKSTCPLKEGNTTNVQKWLKLSNGKRYELIVPPASDLIKNSKSTIVAFEGSQIRTSKQLLIDNIIRNLVCQPIIAEEYFIDPTLILENDNLIQETSEYLTSWIVGKEPATKSSSISCLIADGGVGKTTVSRILCKKLRENNSTIIPILIESAQWRHLLNTTISLNTILDLAVSRRFESAIRILSNETAFRVLVREGLFVIIFDGFDELCVSSSSDSGPKKIIADLLQLLSPEDEPIRARIVLTARKTYWDSLSENINLADIETFQLRGFDNDQRTAYFTKRLSDPVERDCAQRIARQVSGRIYDECEREDFNYDRLSGVPFVLDLIAQYVHGNSDINLEPYETDPLASLLLDICKRENKRQTLQIQPTKQIELFEELFLEYPQDITLDNLAVHLEILCDVHDKSVVERFSGHRLLRTNRETGNFSPRFEVLRVYFIARFLSDRLLEISETATIRSKIANLLADTLTDNMSILDWLFRQLMQLDHIVLVSAIRHACQIINDENTVSVKRASASAIYYVITKLIRDSDKKVRFQLLCEFYNIEKHGDVFHAKDITFKSLVKGFDFSNVRFIGCNFIDVSFKNCIFSSESSFAECVFDGSIEFIYCSNPGEIIIDNCKYSREAEFVLNKMKNIQSRTELKMIFGEEALARAVRKFRKNNRFIPILYQYRKSGFKAGNPYNEIVWEKLFKAGIIQRHDISGVSDGGLNIVDDKDIRREVNSLIDNGVLGRNLTTVLTDIIG